MPRYLIKVYAATRNTVHFFSALAKQHNKLPASCHALLLTKISGHHLDVPRSTEKPELDNVDEEAAIERVTRQYLRSCVIDQCEL